MKNTKEDYTQKGHQKHAKTHFADI